LGSVHAELVGPLKICARAGLSLPRTVARDLLSHFCQPEHFDDLLGHGYLEPEGSARVRFVTQSLWCEAAATPCEQARQIDDWLNEHLTPNPNHTEEAISACNRARRMGDRLRESQHLAKALTQAEAEHRWDRIRQLLAYPGPELGTWTLDGLLQQVQILKNILGAAWSTGRILLVAGEGLMPVDGTLGLPLLERAARENDPHAAVGALCLLLDRAIRHKERESYQHYMDHLEQLEKASRCVPPGLLDFYRAQHAMASGRVEEAETLATQSAKSLRGSGDRHEGLSLQLLAILRFSQDPQIAIEAMCSALAAPQDRERSAQMRSNLTIMYSQVGDLEAGARCADDGIRELWGQVSPARLGGMRIHRAWTWAELDRIDEAVQEARKLLNLAVVRETRHHLIAVRLLLGFCHLHRSSRRVAITETVRGWEEAERGSSSILKADSLRSLIDVLLDLEAWDDVREYGSAMQLCTASTDDAVLTTSIRARALPVQVEGKLGAAAELLESHQNIARGLSDRVASARYLHHLGVVRLAQANEGHGSPVAGEAAQLFREEIGILAEPGHGYYRGRALLALSLALDKAGDHQGASAALHQAVSLARRIKSLGLLAQALQARAWLTVRGKASPELEHQRH
ncbi:MAG: hypothetical protein KAY24_19775, partial [Candidatus Eisenbacteria sp.]|nr:hypothetical protein [Candidatus Eisenbacteria bacterium]